jgi:DNA repair photolyase
LDFESKIYVKEKAPELLREALMKKSWKPEVIMMSGVTDCYQPLERKYKLTRGLLEVLRDFKNPVGLITKNHLVLRDLDILKDLAAENLVQVILSVTTLNEDLGRKLEPRSSSPEMRLMAIQRLSEAGVPVGVNIAPVIPGLTDHEMPAILERAREAGATSAGFVPLRLPFSVTEIFSEWLKTHRPESRDKVLANVRSIRGGELNDPNFSSRMRGEGPKAENLRTMFHVFSKKFGFDKKELNLRTDLFVRPGDQMGFFSS